MYVLGLRLHMYICVTMHANIRRIFRSGERKGLIKADGLTPKLANSAFNRGLSQKAPDGWMDGGRKERKVFVGIDRLFEAFFRPAGLKHKDFYLIVMYAQLSIRESCNG